MIKKKDLFFFMSVMMAATLVSCGGSDSYTPKPQVYAH